MSHRRAWNHAAYVRRVNTLVPVLAATMLFFGAILLVTLAWVGAIIAGIFAWAWDIAATGRGTGELVDGAWSYEVPIERFDTVARDGWCRDAPNDARIDRRQERRYSQQTDRDGDVTTTYREYCWWQADEWRRIDPVVAEGVLGAPPVIPAAVDDGCADLGCRRPGAPVFTGEVRVDVGSGELLTCDVDAAVMSGLAPGGRVEITVSGLGRARCPVVPLPDVEPTPAAAPR